MNDKFSQFEIVSGDDLGFWYNKKNYLNMKGSLGGSCQAVGRLDWLDIYIQNPETVQLIILKSDEDPDKIIGRALLWNLDDGRKLQDYIYTSKDSDDNLFREYAKEKGWLVRNEVTRDTLIAHIKPIEYKSWPSIDTMMHWNSKTGEIRNMHFDGAKQIMWYYEDDDD